jgi:SAM-dependent methyltransferase
VSGVARHVRLRELLVGVEGLALLRHLYDGSDDDADRRLAEVRGLLDDEAFLAGEPIGEAAPRAGYQAWSETYDEPGNPIIALEQPAVWSLMDSLRPGRALDAACGTGRHARHLVELGHEVLGIDLTVEMLERAAVNVPEASFWRRICAPSRRRTIPPISLSVALPSPISPTFVPASRSWPECSAAAVIWWCRCCIPSRPIWVGMRPSQIPEASEASFASTLTARPTT